MSRRLLGGGLRRARDVHETLELFARNLGICVTLLCAGDYFDEKVSSQAIRKPGSEQWVAVCLELDVSTQADSEQHARSMLDVFGAEASGKT